MKQMIDKVTGKVLSRSEAEAKIKDKAGWAITVLAALLAINTYVANGNSSKILNNTIQANNIWAWYQAKNIRSVLVEFEATRAHEAGKIKREAELKAWAAKLESDPVKGEGKKELAAKATKLEQERDAAKQRSPWYTFAGSSFQIAIVLLSASILAVSMSMFWGSIGVGIIASILMSQGLWLWMPL